MPPAPEVVEIRVRYGETDQMGIVYHPNYLVYCEIGRTEFIRSRGTSYAALEASGIRLAVVDASLRYHAPARYDDRLRVTTTLSEVRSRALAFDYVIAHAETGQRLVTARTALASLDASNRLVVLPASVRESLQRAPG